MPRRSIEPRKRPRQSRSRATVDVILSGAARVLARQSPEALTIDRIAKAAGVSVGSLYQYFPSKDALIAALVEREHDRLAADVRLTVQSLAGASLSEALQALVRTATLQQLGSPQVAAALDDEERRLPRRASDQAFENAVIDDVHRLLVAHASEIEVAPTRDAAHDCVVLTRALTDAARHGSVSSADLEARILRAVSGYLGVRRAR